MKNSIKVFLGLLIFLTITNSCSRDDYNFGNITNPSNFTFNLNVIDSVNPNPNPNGDGSGRVIFNLTAENTITYKVDFGDGNTMAVPSGVITYKYTTPGTQTYTVTASAIGKGGVVSSLVKKIAVFVDFKTPATIVTNLTNDNSKTWITDNLTPGHVGVGPATSFTPDYYAASPNQRDPCQYDDEVVFTKNSDGSISMTVNNKGQSYIIAAANIFYGVSGGDGCYAVTIPPNQLLKFSNATSNAPANVSTQIQFTVPAPGIIFFGTGGSSYEILTIGANVLQIRNIGIDGLAWYQILKPKT